MKDLVNRLSLNTVERQTDHYKPKNMYLYSI